MRESTTNNSEITFVRHYATRSIPLIMVLVFTLAATLGVFRGGSIAAIAITGGLLVFLSSYLANQSSLNSELRVTAFVVLFLGLASLLANRTIDTWLGWKTTVQLASILIPLLAWSSEDIRKRVANLEFWRLWPLILLIGISAMTLEYASNGFLAKTLANSPVFTDTMDVKYNRGISYGLLLIWPALALTVINKKPATIIAIFGLLAVALAVMTHSRAVQVALPISIIVAIAMHLWPRKAFVALVLATFLSAMLPFLSPLILEHAYDYIKNIPDSWIARVEIWDYLGYRIRENPLLGWGPGSTSIVPPLSPNSHLYHFIDTEPAAHAHNAWMQFQVELGIGGLILALWVSLYTLRLATDLPKNIRPYAIGAWANAFVLAMVAYNIWADSFLSIIALTWFLLGVTAIRNTNQIFPATKNAEENDFQ